MVIDGQRGTGYRVVRPFLSRLGTFVDEPVVVDGNLNTARDSDAAPPFVRAHRRVVEEPAMKTYEASGFQRITLPPTRLRRRKPRHYREWRTLRQWEMIPSWEVSPTGYLLREARETAGLTQQSLATRLGCTQQAIAPSRTVRQQPHA